MSTRREGDSLGEVELPEDAYYGSFTARAAHNFDITGRGVDIRLLYAIAEVKKAAARVNAASDDLDGEKADAIVQAVDELQDGEFDDAFVLDAIQAGAGTPMHMNVNEVLANRATELLDGSKGEYRVHPNDDVNMGQSTNNVVPTALRLALLDATDELLDAVDALADAFRGLEDEYDGTVKVGRTHLQDAVPVTSGQEFGAWATLCQNGVERIEKAREELLELGIGGNAVGTGINTEPSFREALVDQLREQVDRPLRVTEDNIAMTQSMAPFASVASVIESWVLDMMKVADDVMLLGSGPKAGLAELDLPEVEPGSSIMPGKVNPSITEAFKMSCIQALGDERAVSAAAKEGDLEMNVNAPVIAHNLLEMVSVLRNATEMWRTECVEAIAVDEDRASELFDASTAVATALSPYIGYDRTAEAVHRALEEDRSVRDVVADEGWMTEDELDTVLQPDRMTGPHGIDKKLREQVRERLED
ncbi:MAG: aspartate ammonia-lyase [Candidatus Nanohaloarchaea archaeon]|nr:aspartate ammonia-lyase [Candidatus Nanohaloarchaea archaeon]